MIDPTLTHCSIQSTPSTSAACTPLRDAEDEAFIAALRRIYERTAA